MSIWTFSPRRYVSLLKAAENDTGVPSTTFACVPIGARRNSTAASASTKRSSASSRLFARRYSRRVRLPMLFLRQLNDVDIAIFVENEHYFCALLPPLQLCDIPRDGQPILAFVVLYLHYAPLLDY